MQPWKTVSRKTILNHSRYLVVESHAVQLPDGRVIPDWPWVITPDFVNVVAVTEDTSSCCSARQSTALKALRWHRWAAT
jgi:hypothetical protein